MPPTSVTTGQAVARVPRAPTVGLVVGLLVIVVGATVSAANGLDVVSTVVAALAFAAPAAGRLPVSRRRCVWIAVGWFVIGSLTCLPLFWALGTLVPMFAALGAVPVLIGAGVGWD